MGTPMPTRRTQVERRHHAERALLAAATEVIAERGITGASLGVIGERAGTSRGLPTHHFGSKDGLVARVAERAQDRVAEVMQRAVAQSQPEGHQISGLDEIRVTVDAYLDLVEHPSADDRVLIVMWGATFPVESSVEGMLDADRRAYDGWADVIRRGQRDGSVRPDLDAAASAVVLHGLLRGVAALLLTESRYTDMTRVRSTVVDWIEAALAPSRDVESP